VVELSQSDAEAAIVEAGLTVGNVTFETSTVAFGFVISQNPAGGSSAAEGSPVDLVASLGSLGSCNDCPGGSIVGGECDEIVITEPGAECSVVGVLVTGRVLVRDAENFTMIGSLVNGDVRVINTVSATLVRNQVDNGNLVAKGNDYSSVLRNVVNGGNIRVNDDVEGGKFEQDQIAIVYGNLVFSGNLRVNGNETADVTENIVNDGDITCRENIKLDSTDNTAVGGTVDCGQSPSD